MQPQIDKSLILEAMKRRGMGQQPQPAMQQMTTPQAMIPGASALNTPTTQPQPPQSQANVMPNNPVAPEARAVMAAKGGSLAGLDEDTRNTARALAMKLIKAL